MFNLRLKQLREQFCLSQYAFAKELNVSQSAVGNWEAGKRIPDTEMLCKIADFFNVSIDYLLGRPRALLISSSEELNGELLDLAINFTDKKQLLAVIIKLGSVTPDHFQTVLHMIDFFYDIERKQK